MIIEILKNILRFLILILLQVFIIKNISLGNFFVPMPYILFLLMLPMNLSPMLVLIIGFITGLSIDFFYDSQGIHACASLLVGFLRKYILRFLAPREGYEVTMKPTVQIMGNNWFLYYSIPLIIAHHLLFFILEEFGFENTGVILLKTLCSSAVTFIFIYIFQFLFYRKDGMSS
jgi:rod shape-determining protein MreD